MLPFLFHALTPTGKFWLSYTLALAILIAWT